MMSFESLAEGARGSEREFPTLGGIFTVRFLVLLQLAV